MSVLMSCGGTLCASGSAAPSACSLHPPNDRWMNVEQWWNATNMLNTKWSTVMSPTATGPPHSPHDLPWRIKLGSQRWEVGDTNRLSYSTAHSYSYSMWCQLRLYTFCSHSLPLNFMTNSACFPEQYSLDYCCCNGSALCSVWGRN